MNPGSDCCDQVTRIAAERALHLAHALLHNAGQRATPAGVKGANRFVNWISEKDRKTISGLDGEQGARDVGDQAVASERFCGKPVDAMDAIRMNLAQGDEKRLAALTRSQSCRKTALI